MLKEPFKGFFQHFFSYYENIRSTLLACSGGVDSVVLLFSLLKLKELKSDFQFEVFHLNHQIPGNEDFAIKSQQLVQNICQQYNLTMHLFKVNWQEYSHLKMSQEQLGRYIRYSYMNQILSERSLESITTAHHKDDLLETLLMRLFQGVGVKTFAFLSEDQAHMIRPLSSYSKQELYLIQDVWKIPYCEDPTNVENNYLRNQIRNCLIPEIQKIFPHYGKKVLQFQQLLLEREKYLSSCIPDWEQLYPGCLSFSLDKLTNLPSFLVKDFIKQGVNHLNQEHYLHTVHFNNMQSTIEKYQSKRRRDYCLLYSKQTVKCFLSYGKIILLEIKTFDNEIKQQLKQYRIFYNEELLEIKEWNSKTILNFKYPKKITSFFREKKIHDFEKSFYKIILLKSNIIGIFNTWNMQYYAHLEYKGQIKVLVEK